MMDFSHKKFNVKKIFPYDGEKKEGPIEEDDVL